MNRWEEIFFFLHAHTLRSLILIASNTFSHKHTVEHFSLYNYLSETYLGKRFKWNLSGKIYPQIWGFWGGGGFGENVKLGKVRWLDEIRCCLVCRHLQTAVGLALGMSWADSERCETVLYWTTANSGRRLCLFTFEPC